jgi:hypothetical protein
MISGRSQPMLGISPEPSGRRRRLGKLRLVVDQADLVSDSPNVSEVMFSIRAGRRSMSRPCESNP